MFNFSEEVMDRLTDLYLQGARYIIWDFENEKAIAVNRIPRGSCIEKDPNKWDKVCWNFTETVIYYEIGIDILRGLGDKRFQLPILQLLNSNSVHVTGYAVAYREKGKVDAAWEYSPIFTVQGVAELHASTMKYHNETKIVRAEINYYDMEEGNS